MDSIVDLVVILIVAGVCGALAQIVFGFRRTNFLIAVVVGVAGAYLGTYLAQRLGLPSLLPFSLGGRQIEVVWTFLGAALLMFVLSLIDSARSRGPRRVRRR